MSDRYQQRSDDVTWMLAALILLVLAGYGFTAKRDCDRKGGVLVRGAVIFACVAGPPR